MVGRGGAKMGEWRIDFGKMGGLVPAVVQDVITGEIRMLGFMDEEALRLTAEKGLAHFYSRTRRRLWMKGETSGHILEVVSITTDCDRDSILVKAVPHGPTCHTGRRTCFHNPLHSTLRQRLQRLLEHGLPRPATPLLAALVAEAAATAYPPGTVEAVVDASSDPTYPAYVAARIGAVLARRPSKGALYVADTWRPGVAPPSAEVYAVACPRGAPARCVARQTPSGLQVEGWVP